MFVRVKKKDDSRWQLTIVESVRSGKTVKQRTVRNIGTAYSEQEVVEFRRIGEAAIVQMKNAAQPVLAFEDPANFHAPRRRAKRRVEELVDVNDLREEKRVNEGFTDIFGEVYQRVGLNQSIKGSRSDDQWNDIIQSAVIARIADPRSKLSSLQQLESRFDIKIPFHKIYRAMDQLTKHECTVKQLIRDHTLGLLDEKVDVLFFDVTTLYFESISSDELKDFGFSKDCKFKEVQVMLALVTTQQGLPVTYKLFPGNTFEGHTLQQTLDELRTEFDINNFVFVADRGMFSKDNLEFMDQQGIKYVVGASLKKLPKDVKNDILARQFKPSVVCNEFQWIDEISHDNRRLIVSYSSKRARKDFADRGRLVDRLLKKAKDGKVKIKDLIPNYGTKKYLEVKSGEAQVNESKIDYDAQWDGLYGVITNRTDASPIDILTRYRGLWQIEEAFRVNKYSLKMRPIFHWTPKRIKGHILICFMAYSLVKFTLHQLQLTGSKMSCEKLRDELNNVEASIVKDKVSKKRFVIPSKVTESVSQIYKAFKLKRDDRPYRI